MEQLDLRRDILPLKDKIYRLALRITLNPQEAEDLTQDTLLKVWSKREELVSVTNLEAYCITMCRNLAHDKLALRENKNLSLEVEGTDPCDNVRTPQEQLEYEEKLRYVHRLYSALPEPMRVALQLRDIEGHSYSEAATLMGVTEESFKVTLHRARKSIRTQFEKIDKYGL